MAGGMTNAKKVKAFWWLIGITVAYFAIYYLLIVETEACKAADGFTIQDHWFHGFWDRYLACRQVNELGDALAGAFAPVAFLWLAGAVFIQSKELEAQRQELNETQQVMLQQLEVARQQVAETSASTALVSEQTRLLRIDSAQRLATAADAAFDEGIAAALKRLEHLCGAAIVVTYFDQISDAHIRRMSGQTQSQLVSAPEGYREKEGFKWVRFPQRISFSTQDRTMDGLGFQILEACREIKELSEEGRPTRVENWNQQRDYIGEMRDIYSGLNQMIPALSAAYGIRAERLCISKIVTELDAMISFVDELVEI